MDLKTILLSVLLGLIVLGFISFGYMTYTLYNDSKQQTGAELLGNHSLFFYSQLVIYLLEFGVVGISFYKN